MARCVGASWRMSRWGMAVKFANGRAYETACRFDTQAEAEQYIADRFEDSPELVEATILFRRPGKRLPVKTITRP